MLSGKYGQKYVINAKRNRVISRWNLNQEKVDINQSVTIFSIKTQWQITDTRWQI